MEVYYVSLLLQRLNPSVLIEILFIAERTKQRLRKTCQLSLTFDRLGADSAVRGTEGDSCAVKYPTDEKFSDGRTGDVWLRFLRH